MPSVSAVGACLMSCPILNLTSPWTSDGITNVSFPFFLPNHHLLVSGIAIPQAGFGQVTVRAHTQAITVAWEPSGSFAFG